MLDKSLLEKEFLHKVPEITTHQLLQHIDSIVPFGLNDQPQKCDDDPESELEPKAIAIDRWASLRLPVFQRGAPKTPLSPVSRQSFEVVSPKGWAGSMQTNSPKKVKAIQIHLESVEELPKELNGVESVSFQQLPAADLPKDHRTHLPINQLSPHQMGTTSMLSPMNRTHESMGDWIRSARKFITAMDAPNMPDLIPLKEIHSRPTTAEQKLRIMKEQQVIREKNMQREAKLRQELMEQNKANAKKHVKTLTYDFEGKSFEVNPSKPQGKAEQVVVSLATQINNFDPNEVKPSKKPQTKLNFATSGELTALSGNNSGGPKNIKDGKSPKYSSSPSHKSLLRMEIPLPASYSVKKPVIPDLSPEQLGEMQSPMQLQAKPLLDSSRLGIVKQTPFEIISPTPGVNLKSGNREKSGGLPVSLGEAIIKDSLNKRGPGVFPDVRLSRFDYEFVRDKRLQENRALQLDATQDGKPEPTELEAQGEILSKQRATLNHPMIKGIRELDEPAMLKHGLGKEAPPKLTVRHPKYLSDLTSQNSSVLPQGQTYAALIQQRAEQYRARHMMSNSSASLLKDSVDKGPGTEKEKIKSETISQGPIMTAALDVSDKVKSSVILPEVKPPHKHSRFNSQSTKALKGILSQGLFSYQTPSVSKSAVASKLEDLLSQSDELVSRFDDTKSTGTRLSRPRDRVFSKVPRNSSSNHSSSYLGNSIFMKHVARPR